MLYRERLVRNQPGIHRRAPVHESSTSPAAPPNGRRSPSPISGPPPARHATTAATCASCGRRSRRPAYREDARLRFFARDLQDAGGLRGCGRGVRRHSSPCRRSESVERPRPGAAARRVHCQLARSRQRRGPPPPPRRARRRASASPRPPRRARPPSARRHGPGRGRRRRGDPLVRARPSRAAEQQRAGGDLPLRRRPARRPLHGPRSPRRPAQRPPLQRAGAAAVAGDDRGLSPQPRLLRARLGPTPRGGVLGAGRAGSLRCSEAPDLAAEDCFPLDRVPRPDGALSSIACARVPARRGRRGLSASGDARWRTGGEVLLHTAARGRRPTPPWRPTCTRTASSSTSHGRG